MGAGDKVEIRTESETLVGILMPRPSILDQDIVIIKLDNGYNIGIQKDKIKNIKVLEEYASKHKDKPEIKQNPALPKITILSTGGTISSKLDYTTGGVYADYTAEDFIEMMPELRDIANLKARKILSVMSEDMCYSHWKIIAETIEEELNNGADGVVVTQGTDTLHFSTAALSFLLSNLAKPVVFTAAQRSIDRGSSDAFMNLLCAVHAAKSDIAEVVTCLHADLNDEACLLIRGTKVRKMHTSRRDAFRPINNLPIAKIYKDGRIDYISEFKKRTDEKMIIDTKFEERVALVMIYPGMDPGIIDYHIEKGCKGIVLAATALGHVPTEGKNSLIPELERAKNKGIPVIIATQTIYGSVHPYVYTNLRRLSIEQNCIFVEDLLPEVAYIKLCFVLGHDADVKEMMLTNLHNEFNNSEVDYFLN